MGSASFSRRLLRWFDRHGRHDLPWKIDADPYLVWLSEIMLQQTQVGTVIPYFERFRTAFPDVHSLAAAPLDQVLHHWSGLGYYARARNLHRAAQRIADEFGGEFPREVTALAALPGIGESTAGAICAQAFGIRAPILDGNVKRVLARYHAVAGWPGQTAVKRRLWEYAEQHTPRARVADYTQAIMDLGATVCTRSRPRCEACPLRADCIAHRQDSTANYPGRRPKRALPVRQTRMLVIRDPAGAVLLQQRPAEGLWGGLWSLPEAPCDADPAEACERLTGRWPARADDGAAFRHSFSHYHLEVQPTWLEIDGTPDAVMEAGDRLWYKPGERQLGLAAPVARLLASSPRHEE